MEGTKSDSISYPHRIVIGPTNPTEPQLVPPPKKSALQLSFAPLLTFDELNEKESYSFPNACELRQLKEVTEEILTTYCQLTFTLLEYEREGPSVELVGQPHASFAARYQGASHRIQVNISGSPLAEILLMLANLADGIIPSDAHERVLLFPGPGEAGPINHELEHARRRISCEHNAHSEGEDLKGRRVHFEACAASWARLAHERGSLLSLIKGLQSTLERHSLSSSSLRKVALSLAPVEHLYPDTFAALLDGDLSLPMTQLPTTSPKGIGGWCNLY